MPTDLLSLLQRDHIDLQNELTRLLNPDATVSQLRSSIDEVRLGLTAHAEAEDIVLGRFAGIAALEMVVAQARAAHLSQEDALSALVSARVGTTAWRDRATRLRELVQYHAVQEEHSLLPALRLHLPRAYASLAGEFATERLRQLAMLQPSAPIYITDLAKAEMQFS